VGTPVVMISGFSHPPTEFRTPYRVINFHGCNTCNNCFNDMTTGFDSQNFAWCPRRFDKAQPFQCAAIITPEFVMRVVDKLMAERGLAQIF
jgi:autotransporter strand-loop-strand O-heptosyltransferase